MKKILLILLCSASITGAYADGGLFGLLSSAVDMVAGNSSSDSSSDNKPKKMNIDNGDNITKIATTTDGWTITTYASNADIPTNVQSCGY